jgi:hypothetical protein
MAFYVALHNSLQMFIIERAALWSAQLKWTEAEVLKAQGFDNRRWFVRRSSHQRNG